MARLRIDCYVLDLDRGCLLRDGAEVVLRPKAYAVLRYLAERPGRLVSKEELFAAVWPRLVVTDDALVQSVGEVRRALGDDARHVVRTVPRRGYRLECDVAQEIDPPARPGRRASRVAAPVALVALIAIGTLVSGYLSDTPDASSRVEASGKATIAVLPFRVAPSDASRAYLADGLTQDVINAIGRFSELTVMSWSAVASYRENSAGPGEIARRLGVDYQVEGSIAQSGDRASVTAELVGIDGRVLWSARFDDVPADPLALRARITREVAGALAIRVTKLEQQKVLGRQPESLEAYDNVLRGRYAMQQQTRVANVDARAHFRRALDLDPNCAPAHAGLAESHLVDAAMGWSESPAQSLSRAEEYANAALRIDEQDLRAHVVLGRVHTSRQRYALAIAEMDRTLAINPSSAEALAGRGNVLMWIGQADQAIEALEKALRIDPELNPIDRFALSLAYYSKRRYDAAITQAERNLRDAGVANASRIVLAAAYAQRNRMDDASRVVGAIRVSYPAFDPQAFGSKFLNAADLEHLREGFRKAGLG